MNTVVPQLIAIPALAKHSDIVSLSVSLLSTYYPHSKIIIVSPDNYFYKQLFASSGFVEDVFSDSDYLSITPVEIGFQLGTSPIHRVTRWYFQQFLKYQIVLSSNVENCLILDADTILLSFMHFAQNRFIPTREYYVPYFRLFKELFAEPPPLTSSSIVNFMLFNAVYLKQMIQRIQDQNSLRYDCAILQLCAKKPSFYAFSEYETYANWVALQHGGAFTADKFKFFRRGDLLCQNLSKGALLSVVTNASIKGYSSIAFESNHKSSFLKILFARLLYFFSLSIW
jgi:hypothetical protein